MIRRSRDLLKFQVERLLLRGTQYRLLFIAGTIGLVSLTGGLIAARSGRHDDLGEAVWWAFLRLTDPGYLGDDEGAWIRLLSTVITVIGYVLFMGALIAIMTTWLHKTIERLESGLTAIAQNDHVLVVGHNSRTPTVFRELLESQKRLRRFLKLHGTRSLRLVLLADEVTAKMRFDLRERVGKPWRDAQITMRSGSPLRIGHLKRVDFAHAAAIILPGEDRRSGGIAAADAATIKALLSISKYAQEYEEEESPPQIVAEVFDSRKARIARHAYTGEIEVLGSDELVGSLMAQSIRHPGLCSVYRELLTHGRGGSLFILEKHGLAGRSFGELYRLFPQAVPLGLVRSKARSFHAMLAPSLDEKVLSGDRIVLLAKGLDGAELVRSGKITSPAASVATARVPQTPTTRRVLLVGWNHVVPALLSELDRYGQETVEVQILSRRSVEEREELLAGRDEFRNVRVVHLVGDSTIPGVIEDADAAKQDNIVVLGRDWPSTAQEADAETLVSYLLLEDVFQADEVAARPEVLVELIEGSNQALFEGKQAQLVVSPFVIGAMMGHVALRRELRAVYDSLLGPTGPEIAFRHPSDYDVTSGRASFGQLQEQVASAGHILLGLLSVDREGRRRPRIGLCADDACEVDDGDRLIILDPRA